MQYLSVFPFNSVPYSLTYSSQTEMPVGTLVRIHVKSQTKMGIVCEIFSNKPQTNFPIFEIEKRLSTEPVLSQENLNLIQWLSRYYACSLSVAFETALPAFLRSGKTFSQEFTLLITDCPAHFSTRAKKLKEIYHWIEQNPFVTLKTFRENYPKHAKHLKQLIEQNYVALHPLVSEKIQSETNLTSFGLNSEQKTVLEDLETDLNQKNYSTHLLWGITGSGKTEIYHALIQKAKDLGLQTLYLVPEITLSEQALSKLKLRLNEKQIRVGVWHSKISDSEKMRVWQQAIHGEIDVVLGTRSALFVPLKSPGLTIVDEEHEPSYKQSENPRYHGRDLAIYRAYLTHSLCLLGSATPSIESWANVQQRKYKLHKLSQRPSGQCLPKIEVADMRYEKPSFEGSYVLSNLLREKINACLDRNEQALLFLNRRGYAPYLYCPHCETRLECPHCHSNFVFHKNDQSFRCHICESKIKAYSQCKKCHTPLKLSCGLGTQRVEACLKQIYKTARILRLDSDVLSQHTDWYNDILQHNYDIIIGTQMLAKGLDFPNLSLVGMIQADGQAFSEDFRANERAFQLLIQVSGRSGRSLKTGEVVVQTFSPEADYIRCGLKQDVQFFLDQEYRLRQHYQFPPFRHMIRHIFKCRSENILNYAVQQWSLFLKQNLTKSFEVLGPSSPYLDKINNYHRLHMLYLVPHILKQLPELQQLRQQFKMPKNIIDLWDVDPIDFR